MFRSEDVLVALAAQVARASWRPTDLLGHFSGAGLLALIERGTARDAELWAERLLEKVRQHEFDIGDRNRCKATVSRGPRPSCPIATAQARGHRSATRWTRCASGRARGGDQLCSIARADTDARVQAYDAVWVKHIKAALAENRFRLVQQPIASLAGGGESHVRHAACACSIAQGKEVLPSEFMAAAERNDLVSQIDRWVIMAAARFALRTSPAACSCASRASSVLDTSLAALAAGAAVDPGARAEAAVHPGHRGSRGAPPHRDARPGHARCKDLGLRFALEHFGTGIDPLRAARYACRWTSSRSTAR